MLRTHGRMLVSTPTSCQSRSSVCPFRDFPKGPPRRLRGPRRGRTRTRGGVRRRRAAQAAPRSGGARQVRRRTRTTVRSAGTVGFGPPKRRRKSALQVTFSRSPCRSPGSPSFSPVDESPGLHRRRSALCSYARRRTGPKSSKGWGHDPVVELPQASVDEGRQALEGGGGGGHEPPGGNGRSGLLRRLARRGSASPRRGRGSALGVQRDGQWRGRHSPENVEFWTGNREDDGAARRRGRPESTARRWSLSARPTTGRFSRSPTSRQSTSFTPANISARLPTVATDWYDRVTLRDARRRQGRRYAISATRRRRKRRFLSARFFRGHRRRMREPQGQGLRLRRRPPTRCWSTSA